MDFLTQMFILSVSIVAAFFVAAFFERRAAARRTPTVSQEPAAGRDAPVAKI